MKYTIIVSGTGTKFEIVASLIALANALSEDKGTIDLATDDGVLIASIEQNS